MKLKLDLHPIFSDSRRIEQSLTDVIAEAVEKRASEVEIIPGKGSGALKKTVLRFLDRPEIKSQYHRVEKDDENFGRIFVHFRFTHGSLAGAEAHPTGIEKRGQCFCCAGKIFLRLDEELQPGDKIQQLIDCNACGSPNKMTITQGRGGRYGVAIDPGYEAAT